MYNKTINEKKPSVTKLHTADLEHAQNGYGMVCER